MHGPRRSRPFAARSRRSERRRRISAPTTQIAPMTEAPLAPARQAPQARDRVAPITCVRWIALTARRLWTASGDRLLRRPPPPTMAARVTGWLETVGLKRRLTWRDRLRLRIHALDAPPIEGGSLTILPPLPPRDRARVSSPRLSLLREMDERAAVQVDQLVPARRRAPRRWGACSRTAGTPRLDVRAARAERQPPSPGRPRAS